MYKLTQKFKIDYKGLKEYLEGLTANDFRGRKAHIGPVSDMIRKGSSIDDILHFGTDTKTVPLSDVIFQGQPFLLDLVGNDLTVATLTRKKYRNPVGRLVKVKFDKTIIDDCRRCYGTPLNGYWIIPSQFITYYK